jgi:lipoteichoic acid synthase
MMRSSLYIVCVTAIALGVVAGFFMLLEFPSEPWSLITLAAKVAVFDRFLLDYLVVLLVGGCLMRGRWHFRLVAYFIFVGYVLANLMQLISFYRGGEFLSRLAVENINHISLLMQPAYITLAIVIVVALIAMPSTLERLPTGSLPNKRRLIAAGLMVVMAGFLSLGNQWLPESVVQLRVSYMQHNNLPHSSPTAKFYRALTIADVILYDFSKADSEVAKNYGITINPESSFPMMRREVYRGLPPFENVSGSDQSMNVIVLFAEGFSARMLNVYGSKYEGISPNIDRFAADSNVMLVDNYYNHTAATYRGLHGQLCSIYPILGGNGGWDNGFDSLDFKQYFCLSHYFNDLGFETVFVDTHRKDHAFVDEMMRNLEFQKVWTAEEMARRYLDGAIPLRHDALTDQQLFDALIGILTEMQVGRKQPFFLGLYNLETHAWADVGRDGKKYGDGTNNSLNTIHNFDYAFGRFWNYFKQSPLAENTVLILTSDHAHYPEASYADAAKVYDANYKKVFVDRVPLVIYDPSRATPNVFDANYSTTIDFAPTLLHYLGLPNVSNSFVGRSLFERERKLKEGIGISSFGNDHYLIDASGVYGINNPKSRHEELGFIRRLVGATQKVEEEDRLWGKLRVRENASYANEYE